jgi:hypothetical protein
MKSKNTPKFQFQVKAQVPVSLLHYREVLQGVSLAPSGAREISA